MFFIKIISNRVKIILYDMLWYAMTNKNLMICYEIVCYGMKFQIYVATVYFVNCLNWLYHKHKCVCSNTFIFYSVVKIRYIRKNAPDFFFQKLDKEKINWRYYSWPHINFMISRSYEYFIILLFNIMII